MGKASSFFSVMFIMMLLAACSVAMDLTVTPQGAPTIEQGRQTATYNKPAGTHEQLVQPPFFPTSAFLAPLTPQFTLVFSPSPTLSITATPVDYYTFDYSRLPPLSEIIFTLSDLGDQLYSADLAYTYLQSSHPGPIEYTVTGEMTGYCQEDCAKKRWDWLGEFPANLTITLVRSVIPRVAQKGLDDLTKEFRTHDGLEVYDPELSSFVNANFGLSQDQFLASDGENFIFVTVHGAVLVIIQQKITIDPNTDGNPDGHAYAMQFLGGIQVEKLRNAGYP